MSRTTRSKTWFVALSLAPLSLAMALASGGCRGPTPVEVLGSRAAPEDDWFCDAGPAGEWVCVQDRALVANPQPRQQHQSATVPDSPAGQESSQRLVLGWRPDDYTVQLIALESMSAVDQFAAEIGLAGPHRVRIESGGQVFYALLLGAYTDRVAADRAVAGLPGNVQSLEPWVRKVGPLQEAMRRAQ